MLSLLLIFFTIIASASAVSDNNDFQNMSDDGVNLNDLASSQINDFESTVNGDSSVNDLELTTNDEPDSKNIELTKDSPDYVSEESSGDDLSQDIPDDSLSSEKHKNLVSKNDDVSNANLNGVDSSDLLPQYIKVNDSKYYSSNSLIQKIVDNANPGSTIEFTGSFYKDLRLKISKPLNIISKCGTVINMTYDLTVFTILKGGNGTNISGFTINAAGSVVEASDVSDINIMKNKISTRKTAIIFKNVLNSKIQNNLFSSFKTAIDIRKSGGILISKNNITPDSGYNVGINLEDCGDSGGVRIHDNILTGPNQYTSAVGISVGENVKNLTLKGNTITNWNLGVHFLNSLVNVTIYNNTVSRNRDGLILDKGIMDNFNFSKNIVSENRGVGFLFEDDFAGATSDPIFENNIFSYNEGMAMQSKGSHGFNIGKNLLDGNKLCVKIRMKKGFSIKFRTSGNQIFGSVLGDQGWARDLPDFEATLNVNGKSYKVQFKNGIGYAELDDSIDTSSGSNSFSVGDETRSLSEWGTVQEVSLNEIMPYIQEYLDSFKTPEDNQDANTGNDYNYDVDDHNNHQSNNNSNYNNYRNSNSNSGSGDSGLSNGSSSISSSSSSLGSTSAAGSSAGGSSVGASSASAPSSPEDSATAKTLSVDDETFRVVGVTGLVFLIILVIGLYYRDDVLEMMKEE